MEIRSGRIGFHVGSLGEEASIIGPAFALREQDWIFPCYREFGAALLRGLPLQRLIDNCYGNCNDDARGRLHAWALAHALSLPPK